MILANLKYSRELLDLKQKDVANSLNVNNSTFSGWETGKDTIPIRKLIDYANLYKFSLDYLFGLTHENNYIPIKIDLETIANKLRKLRLHNNLTQLE